MKMQQFLQILAACHKSTKMHPLFVGQSLASNLEDLNQQKQTSQNMPRPPLEKGKQQTTDRC